MKPLGLYLHIPFCRRKCLYCDFCSYTPTNEDVLERYTDALCRDLRARARDCSEYTVDTVYFGGGTPTILPPRLLTHLLETVAKEYHLACNTEITAECNPATGDTVVFSQLYGAGFNRLSMGLQSAHDEELRALGRLHSFADFRKTWEDAREAGFENLSADVMFGIPKQTAESYLQTLDRLCELQPQHISAYGLTVEEETPFGRMKDQLILPDEESTREMYFAGARELERRGWKQYEISNFARAGYESRHNLKYWSCDAYLGFGPGAYSDFGGDRFGNSRDLCAYIEGKDITAERQTPSKEERENEYVMLRMRLCEGVRAADFEARFGTDFDARFGKALETYVPSGHVRRKDGGYAFTREGFYVSNAILSEIVDFSE